MLGGEWNWHLSCTLYFDFFSKLVRVYLQLRLLLFRKGLVLRASCLFANKNHSYFSNCSCIAYTWSEILVRVHGVSANHMYLALVSKKTKFKRGKWRYSSLFSYDRDCLPLKRSFYCKEGISDLIRRHVHPRTFVFGSCRLSRPLSSSDAFLDDAFPVLKITVLLVNFCTCICMQYFHSFPSEFSAI